MIRALYKTAALIELYHYNEFGEIVLGKTRKMRGNCSMLWGDCSNLIGDCNGVSGDCSLVDGDCSELRGDLTGLYGDCTGFSGDIYLCEITDAERKHGVKVEDLVFNYYSETTEAERKHYRRQTCRTSSIIKTNLGTKFWAVVWRLYGVLWRYLSLRDNRR